MHRFRQAVAMLLLVLWAPVVSHCLIEDALGKGDSCCGEFAQTPAPDHTECSDCISLEKGQCKVERSTLPAPQPLDLDAAHVLIGLLFSPEEIHVSLIGDPDDTPPVPPAELIWQATVAQPVRGPSLIV